MTLEAQLDQLRSHLYEVDDLESAAAVLNWDQLVYMPPGGGPARARQRATLGRIAHERCTDPTIGRLLDNLRPHEEALPYDHDDASLIRVTRREYERAVKVPAEFVARLRAHTAASYDAWAVARPANDFAAVRPFLETTLDLSREYAGFFPGHAHIADPLIDVSDHGMTAAEIGAIFAGLRQRLVPLVDAIAAGKPASDAPLRGHFPEARQRVFAERVIARFGYDFGRGRLDTTAHPFMTKFSLGDVRITTRSRLDHLGDLIFSTIHEAGHGMYEQGIAPEFERLPLGNGASSGLHESQSRLWENLVARGFGFWAGAYPDLQTEFPEQLASVPVDEFYAAINRSARTLIRTDADELTYNLHVMIRFDLELALLEGGLEVRDLPDAWNARYAADLGVTPPDDRDGVLQDVHWYAGTIGGAFQGYTLGNVFAAQLYAAAIDAHPEIPDRIALGEFGTLLGWLRANVHRHGAKFTASELIERATGRPLTIDPLIAHLQAKAAGRVGA